MRSVLEDAFVPCYEVDAYWKNMYMCVYMYRCIHVNYMVLGWTTGVDGATNGVDTLTMKASVTTLTYCVLPNTCQISNLKPCNAEPLMHCECAVYCMYWLSKGK